MKVTNLLIYFLINLSTLSISTSIVLENQGIALAIEENALKFSAGYQRVRLTRLYTSPVAAVPVNLIKLALQSEECRAMIREESITNNLRRFHKGLNLEWEEKITELLNYQIESNTNNNDTEE